MYDYGDMLADLAQLTLRQTDIRFEFRGRPRWPNGLISKMRKHHLLHDFGCGRAFEEWFSSFDAYLVVMFFDAAQRRRAETCFATKLADYSRFGRPIIIWAPEASAIVKWARKNRAALAVTNPDPAILMKKIKQLKCDTGWQVELGTRAQDCYQKEFSPVKLQQQFIAALNSVV
jgi:hypothetical protein